MEIYDKRSIGQLNALINQIKKNIKDNINNSYDRLIKNKDLTLNHFGKWKNDILINIYIEINKLNEFISKNSESNKINENNIVKEIKIESKNEFNCFTSKDIQEENKEITRRFQNEAYNYMNSNESQENECVAFFLKDMAKISRISYTEGKKLFQIMKDKYTQLKISKSTNDDNLLIEFSSWVKKMEKESIKNEYENSLNQINIIEKIDDKKNIKYFTKIFYDLTVMYFHCQISFPSVEINFEKNEDFISDKMIDFINRGKKRKVNFIILPALISNGNYLQNGKSWVFTYTKNSYKFDDNFINKYLNDSCKTEPQDKMTINKNKNNLKVAVSYKEKSNKKLINITTNMNIPEEYEFHFHLINKIYKRTCILKTKKKNFEIEKFYEILKYELYINKKMVISSNNIIREF
jgi:hypothetical protein